MFNIKNGILITHVIDPNENAIELPNRLVERLEAELQKQNLISCSMQNNNDFINVQTNLSLNKILFLKAFSAIIWNTISMLCLFLISKTL